MSKEMDLLRRLAEGDNRGDFFISNELLKEIEAILAQPEREPVAYLHEGIDETGETVRRIYCHFYEHANLIPLYTAPQKRERLSDEEIHKLSLENFKGLLSDRINFVRAIEKAHGIGGGE